MNNYELYHSGKKGQKWGERHYQNADGTWTPLGLKMRRAREGDGYSGGSGNSSNGSGKARGTSNTNANAGPKVKEGFIAKRRRLKAEKKVAEAKKKAEAEQKKKEMENETREQRRERLLKSTDPNELYKNRDLLSTAEINERITRINTEAKLADIAASTKKTGREKVDKIIKVGNAMQDLYDMSQKPVFKAIAKQLGISTSASAVKEVNYEDALKNINKLSNAEVRDLAARTKNESVLKKFVNDNQRSIRKATKATTTYGVEAYTEFLKRARQSSRNRRGTPTP